MPKFRVLKKSFVNNTIVEEGEIIELDRQISELFEPLEEEEKPKKAKKSEPAE